MNALIDHTYLCFARAAAHGWTAQCVDLDLAASGRTLAEAQELLRRAIALHIETMEAEELEEGLHDHDRPVVWTVAHPAA